VVTHTASPERSRRRACGVFGAARSWWSRGNATVAGVSGQRMPRRKTVPARDVPAKEILVNLNARVPRELWHRIRVHCTREGRMLRDFITEALEERLRRERRRRS
jgi:hypothetical protein